MTIQNLSIDLETRSGADLSKTGVYRYAESEDFDILLFGVSVNHGPVTVYDLACGDTVPEEILLALTDNSVEKWAYNCSFERICLSAWLRRKQPRFFRGEGLYLDPSAWKCSMILCLYNGLPLGLEQAGAALGLEQQKLKEGKELIRFFCTPCRSPGRPWNLPEHAPEKWEMFRQYNRRDVQVELQIQERLSLFPVPDFVWDEYHQDQEINDAGIRIDRQLVREAIRMDSISRADLTGKLQCLTGLENPNSVVQMKRYLTDHGAKADSLGRQEIAELMKTAPEELREVLSLRAQIAKNSVKKYQAMEATVNGDDRCRGLFQFYGASRTGRWAGRLIQLQNLPQNHLQDLENARTLVRLGDYETLSRTYPSVPGVLSELIRTAFVPREGCKFIVSDFSAVEARALSYLAGEQWRMDVFHAGQDIYCQSAARMFHCVVEKHGQNSHLRQRGKIAELALGYGGSVGALTAMGAVSMGIPQEELRPLVEMWRKANPCIVRFWWDIDSAAKTAIRKQIPLSVRGIRFEARGGRLFITLPSGRKLAYVNPRLQENPCGGESITYMGTDPQKRWTRIETYGPKLVENLTQAICRDILAFAMRNLRPYRIVAHVHDEVILEVPAETSVDMVCEQMSRTPPWVPGLELRADGYECGFYQKQ